MSETIRWTVKVTRETDISLRTYLAQRGLKKGDLSKFIEEAVRRRVSEQTLEQLSSHPGSASRGPLEESNNQLEPSERPDPWALVPSGNEPNRERGGKSVSAAGEPAWPLIEPLKSVIPTLITSRDREISALCRQYGVRELGLFGSVLRSDFSTAQSDIDVTVEFGAPPEGSPARQYFDFKRELEALLAHPVDLVELRAMENTRLKRIIESTQVPIYAAPS